MRLIKVSIQAALFFILFCIYGCQSTPDYEQIKSEILALHQKTIDAHWKKDIDFFTKDISDDYFSVGNGEIRFPTREEINNQFTDYLNNTIFNEYANLQDPIIGCSDDGSVAWSIVRVKVSGVRRTEEGTNREIDFICAWITLYKRVDDKWIRLGEVSSFI